MAELNINLTIDQEVAQDYLDSFADNYEIISNCFMKLDENPTDQDATDEVFRALHTLKGNASMCQISLLTKYTHAIEDVVSALREEKLQYTNLIGEIIMLSLDKAKDVSLSIFSDKTVDEAQLDAIEQNLRQLESANSDQIALISQQIISLISGHIIDSENPINTCSAQNNESGVTTSLADTSSTQDITSINRPTNLNQNATANELKVLSHFRKLIHLTESRLPYLQGRVDRILVLARAINNELGNVVNDTQLEVAVYVHDLSFAFMANTLVLNDSKYDESQIREIESHPELSAAMLRIIPGWEDATKIVEQHHEKWDGSGYPQNLKGDDICLGAQILAILDAYESMTNARPDRQYKRSILRAVTEINNCVEKQFSPELTLLFNKVIKRHLTAVTKS